jgi:hypothetical protein
LERVVWRDKRGLKDEERVDGDADEEDGKVEEEEDLSFVSIGCSCKSESRRSLSFLA